MAATKSDIAGWLKRGQGLGATHMMVICDTFDWDDYPVYIMPGEDPLKKKAEYIGGENMQQIMETYDLGGDLDHQLNLRRSHAF